MIKEGQTSPFRTGKRSERANSGIIRKKINKSGFCRNAVKVVDLTMEIRGLSTPVFPGYPQPLKSSLYTIEEHGYYSCIWTFVDHTATHVDSPAHFVKDGKSVEKIPLSSVVSRGLVLDFRNVKPKHKITASELEEKLGKARKPKNFVILFLTGYSRFAGSKKWFKHPEIGEDACKLLTKEGVSAVGIDAPSPDRAPFLAHRILLSKGVVIFENLTNLEKLLGKEFTFVGAPLLLHGGSASPVRAFALI